MATKTVCDICGKDATGKRTIDVCDEHTTSSGQTRRVKCPECGESFKNQRGLNIHTGRAHATKTRTKK